MQIIKFFSVIILFSLIFIGFASQGFAEEEGQYKILSKDRTSSGYLIQIKCSKGIFNISINTRTGRTKVINEDQGEVIRLDKRYYDTSQMNEIVKPFCS